VRVRGEAAALVFLALIPALPFLVYLATHVVPRFSMYDDYALLELVTRFAPRGRTLLGPYSQFGFNHPGPLYFYVMAPIYFACGATSKGLFVGTLIVNASAIGTSVALLRLLGSRAHAIGAVFAFYIWFYAFGDVFMTPWNPTIIALPLVAFGISSAIFASGDSRAAPFAVFFGLFAAETHVGPALSVMTLGALSIAAFVRTRRAGDRRYLVAAAVIAVVAILPPLFEQLTSAHGNLVKLARFFFDLDTPRQTLAMTAVAWALATSRLLVRLFGGGLAGETGVPSPAQWEPVPESLSSAQSLCSVALIVATIGAAVVARRWRDRTSYALLLVALAANAIALVSIHSIVGFVKPYLVYWVSALSFIGIVGLATTIASALTVHVRGRWHIALASALVIGCAVSTRMQREWLTHDEYVLPTENADLKAVYPKLTAWLDADHAEPVVHVEGAWGLGTVLALELDKDGYVIHAPERSAFMFGRPVPLREAIHPVHVYVGSRQLRLPVARCVESIALVGDIELFVSPDDVVECP
jgi:hypothetical protein